MTNLEQKWRRFLELSGHERGVVVEAAAGLTGTWIGLRLAGFRRWKAALEWLGPRTPLEPFGTGVIESARAIARLESSAARNLILRTNCLERSLVLWWLLRRRGIASELRVGARKNTHKFEAHAWVECGGIVVEEAAENHLHFAPFDAPITSPERSAR